MSFVLGYIHNWTIDAGFMASVVRLLITDRETGVNRLKGVYAHNGLYIAENRNRMVESFLERDEADCLLMVDTDITFPVESVYALADFCDEEHPIVTGMVRTFVKEELVPVWFYEREQEEGHVPFHAVPDIPTEPAELAACGTGFCMVHKVVFDKLKANFDKPYIWFGHDPAPTGNAYGEDLSFCLRAKELGFSVWGIPAPAKHAKRVEV